MVLRLVMRRGIFLMLALVVATAAIAPACAAACCLPSHAARMMAAMPCCAGRGPTMRAQMAPAAPLDATLTSPIGIAPAAAVAAPLVERVAFVFSPSTTRDFEPHAAPISLRI
jgi:hypothetical protein